MGKIYFQSDYFLNNKSKLKDMFGDAACPVDMNAGLVVEKGDKWGMCKDCGQYTQDNIQQRFSLTTPDNESEGY